MLREGKGAVICDAKHPCFRVEVTAGSDEEWRWTGTRESLNLSN